MNHPIATTEMPRPSIMLEQLLDGRYQVLQIVETSGFRQVCIAEDTVPADKPRYLIKCFKLASSDRASLEAARTLFFLEAKKLKNLGEQTLQVPQIIDYFESNQEFYLVEELILGHALSHELENGQQFTETEAVDLLMDVLKTLQLAHQNQILHGDIQPHNLVRRSSDSKLVLVNFAVIRAVSNVSINYPAPPLVGTPSYMPIEQAQGKLHPNCDIYALGLTVIHALTGRHPSLLNYHVKYGNLMWQSLANVNPELEIIIDQMIKQDAEKRYQTAQEVLADLQSFRQPLAPTQIIEANSTRSKNYRLMIGAGVGVAALILGVVWLSAWHRVLPSTSSADHSTPKLWEPFGQKNESKPSSTNAFPQWHLKSTLTAHKGWVRSLVFFPDGQKFASGSYDRNILLWHLTDKTPYATLSDHLGYVSGISAIAVNADNFTLASASLDKTVKLWDCRQIRPTQVLVGHSDAVLGVVFVPQGHTLVSSSADRTIRVWDWQTNKLVKTLPQSKARILSMAISSDGKTLATTSEDKTVKLWNLQTGLELRSFSGHQARVQALAFSPNSKLLATGSQDKTIKLWDVDSGKEIASLTGHGDAITAVAFSADGRVLASSSFDATVKLWDVKEWKEIQTLKGHTGPVLTVVFNPKNNTLLSGGVDRTIKVWQP